MALVIKHHIRLNQRTEELPRIFEKSETESRDSSEIVRPVTVDINTHHNLHNSQLVTHATVKPYRCACLAIKDLNISRANPACFIIIYYTNVWEKYLFSFELVIWCPWHLRRLENPEIIYRFCCNAWRFAVGLK